MSSRHRITTGIAAIIGTSVLAVTPTISSAQTPADWDICPAIDTEPVCDLVAQAASNGAGGRPGTVQPSDCLPPDRSPRAGDVSTCSRPSLDDQSTDAEWTDIPDYNCDEWRNPVIACPGLDDTAEQTNIPDYNCDQWRNPVIACPG